MQVREMVMSRLSTTRNAATRKSARRGLSLSAALLLGAAGLLSGAPEAMAEEAAAVQAEEIAVAQVDASSPVAGTSDSPDAAQAKDPAPVRVQVIAATAQEGKAPGSEVDERLAPLRSRLGDFAFSTYKLVEEKRLELVLEKQQSLSLPGGRTLHITPKHVEASGKLRVHLLVKSRRARHLVDADYSIEPGGDILVGGMRLKKGGALMVAIHHGE